MADQHDPTDRDGRSRRRASPFDTGFVTLWQKEDDVTPAPRPAASDAPARGGDAMLPDAWSADDAGAEVAPAAPEPVAPPASPPVDEPVDIAAAALRDEEAVAERDAARAALRPVLHSLEAMGLYAYITLDDENRWSVASDDERGRVDVRLDDGDFEVIMSATSPGMYADEEQPHRRRSLERLARMVIPRVARGFLGEHQSASWDEVEAGLSVRVRYVLPRQAPEAIGPFVLEHFEELEELLSFIETEISR